MKTKGVYPSTEDSISDDIMELQTVYFRLEYNNPTHEQVPYWKIRKEFWSKVNRISQACSFEFQEDAEAYMDSYRPELMLSLALERALNECRNVKKQV